MKKLVLHFVFLFSFPFAYSQYTNVGTEWYFTVPDPTGSPYWQTFYKYTCTKDTLINSEHYSVITFSNDTGMNPLGINYFISKQNNKVYYWYKNSKNLLFDLNAKTGDTLLLDLYIHNFHSTISKDTVYKLSGKINRVTWFKQNVLQNDSLKKYQFFVFPGQAITGDALFTEKVINTNSKMTFSLLNIYDGNSIFEGLNYLRCYHDSTYNFKINNSIPCDYNNTGINETQNECKGISLSPNPAGHNITIQLEPKLNSIKLIMFDMFGKAILELQDPLIDHGIIHVELDKLRLKPGTYFLRLMSTDGIYHLKFFIE